MKNIRITEDLKHRNAKDAPDFAVGVSDLIQEKNEER